MNKWDLRAGFTRDYDLATSAVRDADKQFADAQKIVENAYALDRTAATQQADINRANQENLEKTMASQARVGDFESAQEIQRALEQLGMAEFEDQPEQPVVDEQPNAVKSMMINAEGMYVEDPNAPLVAAPNEPRAPAQQRRPLTRIEQLKKVEPLLSTPKAKYALRQMIQKSATEEAHSLHNIAPAEAFNLLIKEGIVRGQPLIENDDGTFSRMMPDGRTSMRLDQVQAAAFVGDTINKTNNQFKLSSEDRKREQDLTFKTQESLNKSLIKRDETAAEFELRGKLSNQNFNQDVSLEQIRFGNNTSLANTRGSWQTRGGVVGDSGVGGLPEAGSIVSGTVANDAEVAATMRGMSPQEAADELKQVTDLATRLAKNGDTMESNQLFARAEGLRAIAEGGKSIERSYDSMARDGLKQIAATGDGRPMMNVEYNREIQKLIRSAKADVKAGKNVNSEKIQDQINEIINRAKNR